MPVCCTVARCSSKSLRSCAIVRRAVAVKDAMQGDTALCSCPVIAFVLVYSALPVPSLRGLRSLRRPCSPFRLARQKCQFNLAISPPAPLVIHRMTGRALQQVVPPLLLSSLSIPALAAFPPRFTAQPCMLPAPFQVSLLPMLACRNAVR